eukprot:gene28498-34406_t
MPLTSILQVKGSLMLRGTPRGFRAIWRFENLAYWLQPENLTNIMEKKEHLQQFVAHVRKGLNERVRESRAHILHSACRLPAKQFIEFLKSRLWLDLTTLYSNNALEDILSEYRGSDNLIDTKRILIEALVGSQRNSQPTSRPQSASAIRTSEFDQQSLFTADIPLALEQPRYSPEEIEQKICEKCLQRMKTAHPHVALFKYFRGATTDDTRSITKQGMIKVLRNFDMSLISQDFDAFFAKHDRGDGRIDIPTFLKRLMPPLDVNDNPFSPKDPNDVRLETELMQAVQKATGVRKETSWLNGTQQTRIDRTFLYSLQTPSAPMTPAKEAVSPSRPSSANPFATLPNNRRPGSSHREIRPASSISTKETTETTNQGPSIAIAPVVVSSGSAQPNAPSDETAIYAETLLNAMKDLSILAPAAAATTSAGASTAARPQSAPAYRQLQSQLLMSLARKYAHGEELGLNSSQKAQGAAEADDAGSVVSTHTAKTTQSNQKSIAAASTKSKKRPSSAPPVKSRPPTPSVIDSSPKPVYTPATESHSAAATPTTSPRFVFSYNSTLSPRPPTAPTPPPKSPQQEFARRFVYTGQSYRVDVDPMREVLRDSYRIQKKHALTSHEDYGLYVKSLHRERKVRDKVYERQLKASQKMRESLLSSRKIIV